MLALVVALAALAVSVTATAATPKPKPWQWTTVKVETRLKAATPIIGGDISGDVLDADCSGRGKAVQQRYSRFTCITRWGNTNGSYTSMLTLRVLALGSGKLCVVTTADGRALPAPGPRIFPQRACP